MFILSPIFMRWSAPLSSKTDGPTVSPDGVHILNIHLHSIVCPHQSITMFKRLNPDKDVLQVQHHSHLLLEFTRSWLSLNNIAPSWSKHVCSSVYNQEVFFFHCQMLIHNFDGLWHSSSDSFFAPQLVWMRSFFLFKVHCIAPRWLNLSRSVEKSWCHFCQGFCKFNLIFFLFDNLSCSGIKSHISNVMSIQV